MKNLKINLIVLFATALLAGCDQGSTNPPDSEKNPLLIKGVNIIDMRTGDILENYSIIVVDNRIDTIAPAGEITRPGAAQTVDATGKYVIPGLYDMHVHFGIWEWQAAFPPMLKNGVLGVRDMGWAMDKPVELRNRVNNTDLIGPKMFVAGPTLDGPTDNWPFRVTVENVDQVEGVIADLKSAGVDFVKVHGQLDRDVYFAIAQQATAAGFAFSGHIPSDVTPVEAADAGQASLEHLIMPWCEFNDDGCGNDETLAAITAFKKNGTWLTPTATVYQASYRMWAEKELLEEHNSLVTEGVLESWDLQARVNEQFLPPPEQRAELYRGTFNTVKKMIRFLQEQGVRLMTGTDTGYLHVYPGYSVWDEMEIWTEAGVTPLQALQAATINPVEFLGIDKDHGAIAEGFSANFVMLDANPLLDIAGARDVHGIVLDGVFMSPSDIDGYFEEISDTE